MRVSFKPLEWVRIVSPSLNRIKNNIFNGIFSGYLYENLIVYLCNILVIIRFLCECIVNRCSAV